MKSNALRKSADNWSYVQSNQNRHLSVVSKKTFLNGAEYSTDLFCEARWIAFYIGCGVLLFTYFCFLNQDRIAELFAPKAASKVVQESIEEY
jgi:hypothetical protein